MEKMYKINPDIYFVSFRKIEVKALTKSQLINLITGIFSSIQSIVKPLMIETFINCTEEDFPYKDLDTKIEIPVWQIKEKSYEEDIPDTYSSSYMKQTIYTDSIGEKEIFLFFEKAFSQSAPDRAISFESIIVNAVETRVFLTGDSISSNKIQIQDDKETIEIGLIKRENECWIKGPLKNFEYAPVTLNINHDSEFYSINFHINISAFLEIGTREHEELKKCFTSIINKGWQHELPDDIFKI